MFSPFFLLSVLFFTTFQQGYSAYVGTYIVNDRKSFNELSFDKLHDLENLAFMQLALTSADMETITTGFQHLPSLKQLSFVSCEINSERFSRLAESLQLLNSLKTLSISDREQFGKVSYTAGFEALVKSVHMMPNLRFLALGQTHLLLTPEDVTKIVELFKAYSPEKMKSLHLLLPEQENQSQTEKMFQNKIAEENVEDSVILERSEGSGFSIKKVGEPDIPECCIS